MKKVFAIILSAILILSMSACGDKESSTTGGTGNENGTVELNDVSVTINGFTYNEDDYNYYLDITVVNNTDMNIQMYNEYIYLNGYLVDGIAAVKLDSKATVDKMVTIDRAWLIYYYNLCGLSYVDKVDIGLHVSDILTNKSLGEIAASAEIDKFVFEENKLSDKNFNTDISSEIYNDDKCKVTLLTFYESLVEKSSVYFLVENINIDDDIVLNYNIAAPQSYSEILDDIENGGDKIFAEVNSKKVQCNKFADIPGEIGVTKGNKAIVMVHLDLENSEIALEDISNIKMNFVIESGSSVEKAKYAEFTMDWRK